MRQQCDATPVGESECRRPRHVALFLAAFTAWNLGKSEPSTETVPDIASAHAVPADLQDPAHFLPKRIVVTPIGPLHVVSRNLIQLVCISDVQLLDDHLKRGCEIKAAHLDTLPSIQ